MTETIQTVADIMPNPPEIIDVEIYPMEETFSIGIYIDPIKLKYTCLVTASECFDPKLDVETHMELTGISSFEAAFLAGRMYIDACLSDR